MVTSEEDKRKQIKNLVVTGMAQAIVDITTLLDLAEAYEVFPIDQINKFRNRLARPFLEKENE